MQTSRKTVEESGQAALDGARARARQLVDASPGWRDASLNWV